MLIRGVLLRRNTAPLWFWRSGCDAALGSSAPGRFLIPAGVTLSNAVSRSLPRSLCLSICQSAVSHCFIPPPPPPLAPPPSLSVCRSLAQHQGLLFSFAHLTSCPAHSPALSLTSITVLISCTARVSSQAGNFFFLSLSLLPLKW